MLDIELKSAPSHDFSSKRKTEQALDSSVKIIACSFICLSIQLLLHSLINIYQIPNILFFTLHVFIFNMLPYLSSMIPKYLTF